MQGSSSGVSAGFVKREFFPSPVYGGRCPKGGRVDEVAKRRKRWICQAVSLLGFTAASLAFETLQATSLHSSFCHSAAVLFQKLPSGVSAELVKRDKYWIFIPPSGYLPPQAGGGIFCAKRRKCWTRQVAWLLGFVETLPATSQKRKTVLRRAMSFLPKMQKTGCARSAG